MCCVPLPQSFSILGPVIMYATYNMYGFHLYELRVSIFETLQQCKTAFNFFLMFNIKVQVVFDIFRTANHIVIIAVRECGIIAMTITIFPNTNMKTVILWACAWAARNPKPGGYWNVNRS